MSLTSDCHLHRRRWSTLAIVLFSTLGGIVPSRATDVPSAQVFVPGFTVRELPVQLTNINNVRYRHDGKLVALAYNGRVHLLSDTNADGLEDRADLFWNNPHGNRSPIGMALTPPGYAHGEGLFVASYGKLSLIVDTDGDDRAGQEIVIATGWPTLPHGVDTLGVAFDERDGSVYFGLGCADYTNAYQLDSQGFPHYDRASERGTIMRVAPDLKSREIVCTGIRFPVGLAFDRHGELFCTDQEGATWLANGNPFDELLHIERGRHYGFPPRHPVHLEQVIDEPSVFDYGPQHQSTCGLVFNEALNGGSHFGPRAWEEDAFVCGYSRGKIYRTKLVRAAAGYMAQNQLLASFSMLVADACVTPDGGLLVAAHSGGPDWGSGPDGPGKLFKIEYQQKEIPQPVLVYPRAEDEVCIAFDRPLEAAYANRVSEKIQIEFGPAVRAGDRFESLRPGYAVVAWQQASPRFRLAVNNAMLSENRRSLFVKTGTHQEAVHYALTMPWPNDDLLGHEEKGALEQSPQIDLDYDSCGVEATWQPAQSGVQGWQGWLPHADLAAARTFTAGSAEHELLWQKIQEPGLLTLRTTLDLADMLRPAVQPGSSISYQWPDETVTLVFRSSCPAQIRTVHQTSTSSEESAAEHLATVTLALTSEKRIPLEIKLNQEAIGAVDLAVTFYTAEDERERTLPLRRLLLPWAQPVPEHNAGLARGSLEELRHSDWDRGRALFYGAKANCAKCHTMRGTGAHVGPDLSNLVHRDYASVLRDIREPSYAINPEYVTFMVALTDGRVLKGPLRTVDGSVHIADEQGEITIVPPDLIDKFEAGRTSIMPEGLLKELGARDQNDLMAFLLLAPPAMPDYGEAPPPPPRRREEVDAILAGAEELDGEPKQVNIVLVAGPKDHGAGEHDYPAFQKMWHELLSQADATQVATAWEWPSGEQLKTADVLVFYQRGDWNAERAAAIDAFLARGGGLVYIHWAVDGRAKADDFARRIGLAWGKEATFRHGSLELDFMPGHKHPIARNFAQIQLHDESYWQLTGDPSKINLLASGMENERPQPLFWTTEHGQGRVFVSIPGHFSWTFDDPLFRVLLLRGIAWSAHESVDRFNKLVTIGARISHE